MPDAPPPEEIEEPDFDQVVTGWDEELRRQLASGELSVFTVWQACKESMERLADEFADDDEDDPNAAAEGYPRLLDSQNAAVAQLVTVWTEWAPILVNLGDPTVRTFVERYSAILRHTLGVLLPSAGVGPDEVDEALAALPLNPQPSVGPAPANGRTPAAPPA